MENDGTSGTIALAIMLFFAVIVLANGSPELRDRPRKKDPAKSADDTE
jgi:hypothetical protein